MNKSLKKLGNRIVFLLITVLLTMPKSNVTRKVKAEESGTWTEVANVTNGRHYLISVSLSEEENYYLKADEYTGTPSSSVLTFDETLTLDDAWTFIGDEITGYMVTATNGSILYHRNSATLLRSAKNISNTYKNNKHWQYVDGKLRNNGHYLAKSNADIVKDWRAPDTIIASSHITDIILYEYTPVAKDEVDRFISIKDAWFGQKAKGKCEEFVPPLLTYYDGLSNSAKELLSSNQDYSLDYEEVLYFTRWYANNIMTNGSILNVKDTYSHNSVVLLIAISVLSFSGYILLLRYKKEH